jgi:DNA gyrase subunit A
MDGDGAAASRYTEARLTKLAANLMDDLDKDTIDWMPNYDGSFGFNLKEICAACIAYIKDNNVDLTKYISAPDFSTGGQYIYDEDELRSVFETGRGTFRIRAKWRFDRKAGCVEVYEIPYTATVEAIIDKIAALVKSGKLRDVTDARDETGLDGLKIAIDIRRSSDPETVMKKLLSQTPLSSSYSCNFNILIDGRPKVLGVRQILKEWLNFRAKCVKRTTEYDLNKNLERLHLLTGLEKIILDIDKAIRIIRQTADDNQVIPNLCQGFKIDEPQAEFIAEIKLRNLNKEYLLKLIQEIANLKEEIRKGQEILKNSTMIYDIIIAELIRVSKKYANPRKTDIIYTIEEEKVKPEDLIDDYAVRLFMTREGYFKKITHVSLRSSGEQNVKDGDAIIQQTDASNKSEIILFTDKNTVYKTRLHEIAESKASSLGEFLQNILGAEADERFLYFALPSDYRGFMFFCFKNGKTAKVEMSAYATKTNRRKLVNAYGDKSPVVFMEYVNEGEHDFILMRDRDKALLINTALIPLASTKNTQGVQTLTLKRNSILSSAVKSDNAEIKEIEFYRSDKIPSAGHFIKEEDKPAFGIEMQLKL